MPEDKPKEVPSEFDSGVYDLTARILDGKTTCYVIIASNPDGTIDMRTNRKSESLGLMRWGTLVIERSVINSFRETDV